MISPSTPAPSFGAQSLAMSLFEKSGRSPVLLSKSKKSLPQIAGELHVDAVVEGAVQLVDNRVRVTAQLVDGASPIAYGYDEKISAYCDDGVIFSLSSVAGGRRRRRLGPDMKQRPTGRGTKDEPDFMPNRLTLVSLH